MPQQSCPWCSHCGPRYDEGTPRVEIPGAHSDGTTCVCRHITCQSRQEARAVGGRYFDAARCRWVCLGGCEALLIV